MSTQIWGHQGLAGEHEALATCSRTPHYLLPFKGEGMWPRRCECHQKHWSIQLRRKRESRLLACTRGHSHTLHLHQRRRWKVPGTKCTPTQSLGLPSTQRRCRHRRLLLYGWCSTGLQPHWYVVFTYVTTLCITMPLNLAVWIIDQFCEMPLVEMLNKLKKKLAYYCEPCFSYSHFFFKLTSSFLNLPLALFSVNMGKKITKKFV